MKHAVPHDLGQERAKKAAEAAISAYEKRFAQYRPSARWLTPSRAEITFNVKGMALQGYLEVLATTIEMDLDVPLLLRPFKTIAIGAIETEVRKWIAKAKTDEL